MQVIDGKKLREEILAKIKSEVASLNFSPIFCDVLVGKNPASVQYVQMKGRMAEAVGITFHNADFPDTITTNELVREIENLNKIKNMCGIIVQLPLPGHIDKQKVFDVINPTLDVDCLGTIASEKFYKGDISIGFPTALSCMALLDSINIDLKGKNIVVLGQGMLVGKPVTALLQFRNLYPVIIIRETENKNEMIKQADVIISGTGQAKLITGDMIKAGVVIIDAGTSESNGGIVGDVDFESVRNIASFLSPVPGGVGPVTVAMLLRNVLKVAKKVK